MGGVTEEPVALIDWSHLLTDEGEGAGEQVTVIIHEFKRMAQRRVIGSGK